MAYLKKLNSVNSIELTATSATGGFIKQTHPATSGEYAGTHPLLHTWRYNAAPNSTDAQMAASNLFVGQKAGNLSNNLTATQCVAVGERACNVLTSGGANTILGWYAGLALTSGNNNVGVGKQSLTSLTTGQSCTAVGSLALGLSTTSTQNSAFGQACLYNLTSGGNNVGVGVSCGGFVGNGAVPGVLVTSATNCTFLGALSGSNLAAGGNFRTALGSGAICTHDNAIKLGRNAIGSGLGTTSNEAGDVTIISAFNNTQRDNHAAPINGSIIYNSQFNEFQVYANGGWLKLETAVVSS